MARSVLVGRPRQLITILLSLPCLLLALGCGTLFDSGGEDGPLSRPELLTPVAQAQEEGVRLYWLGEQFEVEPLVFQLAGGASLVNRSGNGPGLKFQYIGSLARGNVVLGLGVLSEQSGEGIAWRDTALAVPGAESQDAQVGPWEGELFVLPAGTRPVNQLWLFVDLGETIVVAQALSGSSGVPGTDGNPLIDAELLIEVLAEHLRPYPQ